MNPTCCLPLASGASSRGPALYNDYVQSMHCLERFRYHHCTRLFVALAFNLIELGAAALVHTHVGTREGGGVHVRI